MQKFIFSKDVQMFKDLFGGNGCRQVWCRYSDGNFKEIFFCKSDVFPDKLEKFIVSDKFDYYVTKNAFYADRRSCSTLCYLDNIVIDIDNHDNISADDIEFEISRLLYLLSFDYEGKFPLWKFSLRSGRGVQLWIHLESIAPALTFLYDIVVKSLCNTLTEIINDNNINLSVDVAASCNPAGLVRLPFTFNTHNNFYIDDKNVEFYDYSTYTIDDLISEFGIEKSCKTVSSERPEENDDEYAALHCKRINFIEKEYVKRHDFDVSGHRNASIFLYYNACVQVMERSSALERTEKLNKSFKKQYSESEFRAVIATVDKHIYRLKTETFFDILGLSEDERKVYHNMSYKKKIDKVERNKKIFQLAVQRKTCQEIADEVGCSIRTVKTVLKDFNKSEFLAIQVRKLYADGDKTQQEIADIFNVSVRQIRRYLKT